MMNPAQGSSVRAVNLPATTLRALAYLLESGSGARTIVPRTREQARHPRRPFPFLLSLNGPRRQHGPYNLGVAPNDENLQHGTDETCELCGRTVGRESLTRHHLLPRAQARRMRRRRMARRALRRRDPGITVDLCRPCHRNVHTSLSNGDLGRHYDRLEALSAHPDVRRFTEWVRDKPHGRG